MEAYDDVLRGGKGFLVRAGAQDTKQTSPLWASHSFALVRPFPAFLPSNFPLREFIFIIPFAFRSTPPWAQGGGRHKEHEQEDGVDMRRSRG